MYENIDDNGKIVILRKPKRCEWCGQMIEKGEEAVRRVYKFDGVFTNSRMHPECYIAMRGSYSEHSLEEGFYPGEQTRGKTIFEAEEFMEEVSKTFGVEEPNRPIEQDPDIVESTPFVPTYLIIFTVVLWIILFLLFLSLRK